MATTRIYLRIAYASCHLEKKTVSTMIHVATFILSHERAKLVDLCQSSGNGLTPYASSPDDGNDVDNDEYDLLSNNNLFLR
ncbi:11812_t:CDS:2 [Entrophospora sp. SA101]|nr:112_t:CDS:2 [Entrophospora sp. SA101]CAJ0878855.1 11812_t:CDS:2 [Entrophospora sp. SA101]